MCVGSLSKASGLPGLRLGWLVASSSLVEQVCTLSSKPPRPRCYSKLQAPYTYILLLNCSH